MAAIGPAVRTRTSGQAATARRPATLSGTPVRTTPAAGSWPGCGRRTEDADADGGAGGRRSGTEERERYAEAADEVGPRRLLYPRPADSAGPAIVLSAKTDLLQATLPTRADRGDTLIYVNPLRSPGSPGTLVTARG